MVLTAKIGIVQPAPPHTRSGNRVTALRWACHLRALGHRVVLEPAWSGRDFDVLVALHAEKTASSVERFVEAHPARPVVVVGTGTDVYGGERLSVDALQSFSRATRIVVLQERALARLPEDLRERARVIVQSSATVPAPGAVETVPGRVTVLAHLRAVKDPLLPARAVRDLPEASRVHVELLGGALEDDLAEEAQTEDRRNERFRWRGDVPHAEALATLAGSWLSVVPSRHEGGSNATCEALAAGVGLLATDIPGNHGLLGEDHPGLFPVGDADRLRALLLRAEDDPGFHDELVQRSLAAREAVSPTRERAAWAALLDELVRQEVA